MTLKVMCKYYFSIAIVLVSIETFIQTLWLPVQIFTQVHWTLQHALFYFYNYICFLCLYSVEISLILVWLASYLRGH